MVYNTVLRVINTRVSEMGCLPPIPASYRCKAALKRVNSDTCGLCCVGGGVVPVALENTFKETDADTGSWKLAGTHWNSLQRNGRVSIASATRIK